MPNASTQAPNPASESVPAYRVEQLRKIYGEGEAAVQALRGVSIEIPKGETVVFLGPSGSGKSTLLNIMGGLDRATSGSVEFLGRELTGQSDGDLTLYRRQHVGFVFQFYNLMPGLTALENVELVTEITSEPMPAADALTLVGLGNRMDHFPAQLSGGEQQRVAIARAIAKRPTVMFCDEPTGALDRATGLTVLEALAEVNREFGTTLLIVTHNAGVAGLADRVVRFIDGAIDSVATNATKTPISDIEW
ncbi:MAG: ABC transporter ATP-binding protein [Rhodospirillaceae bacterium]|nr:ABC transporter ATP-binding protein [Rhodospirillaceae bacterium]MBT6137312.1 ABC transporter ATP-binding protein [Rhodospirillaceae bacterium]